MINNEELMEKIKCLANDYDSFNRNDFEGCLLALEQDYGVHYQELFNAVAKIIVEKKIEYIKDVTLDYSSKIQMLKGIEKEFDCNIDYIDYSISFKYM